MTISTEHIATKMAKYRTSGALIALVALAVVAVAWFDLGQRPIVAQSMLFGWFFWATLTLGCFGMTLLHHSVRGKWGLSVLRYFEAGGGPEALAVTGIAGAFVLFPNLGLLYPWAQPDRVSGDPILQGKAWYLNEQRFLIGYIIYFAIFITLASLLRQSSRLQDETLEPKLGNVRHSLGPVGMVIYFVTMTFAATDWIMALEPHWFSSILPLLISIGGALTALSLAVVFLLMNRDEEPYASVITPQLTRDLGLLLFAMTLLWQYLTLSQYLIQWSGNLPEEVPYYLKHNTNGWNVMSVTLMVGQFFLPFLALVFPRTRRYARNLLYVAAFIFAIRFIDVYWTVLPSLRGTYDPAKPGMSLLQSLSVWTDYVALIGFGGLWFAVFGSQIAAASLIPKHDTRLLEVEHAH